MIPSMKDQRIGRRVLLIVLVFAIPFSALAVWLLARGINGHIAFAQQERRGNDVLRPLEAVLQAAGRVHLASASVSGGTRPDVAAVTEALQALDENLATQAEALQITPAGLASRHREGLAPAAVRQRWETAVASGQSLTLPAAALMADARGLIGHTGDTSNLILDPDLDSYYLMDATLCVLPELQERVALVTTQFGPIVQAGVVSADARREAAVQAALLRQTNVARIDGDIQTALSEDANFYGPSPTLAPRLTAAQSAWHQAIDAYVAEVDGIAAGKPGVTRATLTAAGRAAHDASFEFWRTATAELDELLDLRIAAKARERRNGLLALAALIAGASGTAWLITRQINRQLRVLCLNLTDNSKDLEMLAKSVSSSSHSLADGASEQAASLEEISSTLEEISGMARTNADSISKTHELADGMRLAAETGSQDIAAMSKAMDAIQAASGNIAKIIKTIDEISFQTNILALNAAVEAARAGEAGAGFAVVAEEVRNLAKRAASAARETSERIEDCIVKSRDGAAITQKVNVGFVAITAKAREVNELVTQITTATQEQSTGIQQVNQATSELDSATQKNAASAEETAAAAEQLNNHAVELDRAVLSLVTIIERREQNRTGPLSFKAEPAATAVAKRRQPGTRRVAAMPPAAAGV